MPRRLRSKSQVLREVPLFADLAEKETMFLATRVARRQYKRGQAIFHDGEPCRGFFVVESGVVRLFKTSVDGREQVLAIMGPGNVFGELPVFDGGPYPASAAALSEASVFFVSKEDFHALCRRHPEVLLKVLQVVASHLRRVIGVVEELSFTTVRHRLAVLLLQLARRRGKRATCGIQITLTSSHEELAAHIGSVRELVSRNLSQLQAEGLIKRQGKNIIIPDLKALAAEVERTK